MELYFEGVEMQEKNIPTNMKKNEKMKNEKNEKDEK